MKIQHLEITAAYASLNSDLAGLEESEAKRRRAEFGPNRVEEITGEPLILTFAREFGHFFAIILWIAAGLAFFARVEAARTRHGDSRLRDYRRDRDQRHILVLASLSGGAGAGGSQEAIATLTGESVPSSRDAQPCDEAETLRSSNILLAGTSLVSGEAKALVFATGIHSAFGQIAHLTQTTADTISPLQTEIIRHLPALGLGAEKPGPDIMKAPPRRRDQRLLGGTRLARA